MSSNSNSGDAMSVVRHIFIKPEYQAMIEALYNKTKLKAKDLLANGVDMTNILLLTDAVMKQIGHVKNMVGFEKKALVMTVVRKLAEDTLDQAKQAAIDAGKKMEEVMAQVNAEFEELKVILDKALDPFIDQLYSLAPKVYGQVKAKCLPCIKN